MNVSPNILAKNQNFKKLRHAFVDERAMITGKPLYLFISLIQFLLSESFIWKLEKNTSGFLQTMLIQHFKIFIFLLSYLQLIKLNMINQAYLHWYLKKFLASELISQVFYWLSFWLNEPRWRTPFSALHYQTLIQIRDSQIIWFKGSLIPEPSKIIRTDVSNKLKGMPYLIWYL